MGKNKTGRIGVCKFCGQQMLISELPPLPDGVTYETFDQDVLDEMYNDEVAKQCTCDEGREWRQKQKAATLSDENIDNLTEADEWLKEIITSGRNQMLNHPEMKGMSITVVDPASIEKRAYKLKTDKDGNVIATRTNSTAAAEIIN